MQQLRKNAGLTQQDLADKLHIDRSTIAKWESGESVPRLGMIPEIASILGCSVEEIVERFAKRTA